MPETWGFGAAVHIPYVCGVTPLLCSVKIHMWQLRTEKKIKIVVEQLLK